MNFRRLIQTLARAEALYFECFKAYQAEMLAGCEIIYVQLAMWSAFDLPEHRSDAGFRANQKYRRYRGLLLWAASVGGLVSNANHQIGLIA